MAILEWKPHVTNLHTEEIVYVYRRARTELNPFKGEAIYKCRGRIFKTFRHALMESCEHGNATGAPFIIETHWDDKITGENFWVYSRTGTREGTFSKASSAVTKIHNLNNLIPPLDPEKIKRRREAYLKAKSTRENAIKRRLIEAEKERILMARRSAQQRAKYSEKEGSW